ncbi:MAG: hypothetical protein A2X34_07770 [Elusimicrobia bacterium GWC2_51_8]|nr:MAG: hypothetical protein A2X33_03175 [Elusimicrobia bacterium GWA2_51_34]OGR59157.1 MAG: hypothetical protein A2X34_07770 [Elusimicrobia bacterium GWC2_51_8]HAF94859.1 hypothetical protein [Elusimicrobiota bacterium]HCE97182.1 hypothetical protein [Elusimicrobiota bacterium]
MRLKKRYLLAGVCLVLSVYAFGFGVITPEEYDRLSVLTPPGPVEPLPEVFQKVPRLIHAKHKVGKGEDVRTLAARYNTDPRSLQSTNGNEFIFGPARGRYMRVHNGRGYLYEVTGGGETLNGLAARFKPGASDFKSFKALIIKDNDLPPSAMLGNYKFKKGDRIFLASIFLNLDTYRLPFNSGRIRISSNFGYRYHPILRRRIFHKGCDIPMPLGSSVYPSRSGTVVFAGWKGGYGNVVEVRHKDGSVARYGHLSIVEISNGATVQKSKTRLGKVGSTGMSTGPHLHFEIITPSGKSINPLSKIGRQ